MVIGRPGGERTLLTVHDHDRRRAGRRYVYYVVSRRARGVSIGINLNPNAACNWRCIYCQVPGLTRGAGPAIDLERLAGELAEGLNEVLAPGWMETHVPAGLRRLTDVAFSGDGEPTTAPDFPTAVDTVAETLGGRGLRGTVKLLLITNGSQLHRRAVRDGVRRLAAAGGELWFKVDGATDAVLRTLNDARTTISRQQANLVTAARLAPTWVQTLVFLLDGRPSLGTADREAYVALLRRVLTEGAPLRGVHLYGLARPSQQPEAPRLAPLPASWLEAFAAEIREGTGLEVSVAV